MTAPTGYGPRLAERPHGIGAALVLAVIVALAAAGVVLMWDLTVVNGKALAAGVVWSLAGVLAWRLHRTGGAR